MEVHGTCEPGFEAVAEAFAVNFAEHHEVGAAVCVYHRGRAVVDLWGGLADRDLGRPWEQDTLVNVWSTTKTMAAISMLMAADHQIIDLEAPVCEYWPEFATNGKEGVLVSHVMSHTAGLSGFDPPITATDLYDQDKIAEGSYGRCDRCGTPIPAERLTVRPWATHCVTCPTAPGGVGTGSA